MKKIIIILFFLSFTVPSFAATVGGPDISIPEESLYFKDLAVAQALDQYESNANIKASIDAEYMFNRELKSAPADVAGAVLEGNSYAVKISNNFYNVIEPYVKLGTSDFTVQWDQFSQCITVETDPGFVWTIGVKAKIWEFIDYGVKLTLDAQYRNIDLDIDKMLIGGITTETANAVNEDFQIKDWQVSLLASKKFILPVGRKDFYIVPYAGMTFSDIEVDAHFTRSPSHALLYSTYNASDKDVFGAVFGFDVMPNLWSWYLLNFEARLINETAFSIGSTLKF